MTEFQLNICILMCAYGRRGNEFPAFYQCGLINVTFHQLLANTVCPNDVFFHKLSHQWENHLFDEFLWHSSERSFILRRNFNGILLKS